MSVVNSGEDAVDYFYVLPDSGDVMLAKSLTQTERSEFRVSERPLTVPGRRQIAHSPG